MPELRNLVVDLDRQFVAREAPGIDVGAPVSADERTLAWIDDTFGGSWSCEAAAGRNIVAARNGKPVGFATIDARGLSYSWLRGVGSEAGVGVLGPLGVAVQERRRGIGGYLLRRGLDALRALGYSRALVPAVGDDRLVRFYESAGARVAERFDCAALYRPARRTLVMASGNGSNFAAVAEASRNGNLPLDLAVVFGNDMHAYVFERARAAGVPSHLIAWDRSAERRSEYDRRLLEAARAERPDLVLLLGWMHLLSSEFVAAFPEMLNLHPAFLPLDPARDTVTMPDGSEIAAFRGPRAVRDALAAGSLWTGATLHRVTAATDRGPVLARKPLRIEEGEAEAALMQRVHELERGVVRSGIMRWLFES